MGKNTMFLGIRFIIMLVVLLTSQGLTTEIAWAALESKHLETADDLLGKARETVNQVNTTGDDRLAEEALELAEKIAQELTLASVAVRQMDKTDPAMMTADLAGQTAGSVVYEIVKFSREPGNIELLSECLDVAERLCKLVYTISVLALERGEPELATAASNAANYNRDTIRLVAETARYIAQTSDEKARVDAAEELYDKAEDIQPCLLPDAEGYIPPPRELNVEGDDFDDDCASCV
jgi:hypothetical protein